MASDDLEEITFEITGPNGTETITLPAALVEALSEGTEDPATVFTDIALQTAVNSAHHAVHHADGDIDEDLVAAEERARELFEQRFGISFAEATGHSH